MQNAVGGLKDAVRGKQRASTVNGACHGNDLIIVVLVLLFGGGGGYWGRNRGYW